MPDVLTETTLVRIRFAGCDDVETYNMDSYECARFHSDWKSYLGGNGAIGGEYSIQDGDHNSVISLNFSQVAFIEPGKTY